MTGVTITMCLSTAALEAFGGVVGAGKALPAGEQNILNLIENPKWYGKDPKASSHPRAMRAGQDPKGYAKDQGEAEMIRLNYVIDQLDQELKRRGCP